MESPYGIVTSPDHMFVSNHHGGKVAIMGIDGNYIQTIITGLKEPVSLSLNPGSQQELIVGSLGDRTVKIYKLYDLQ